MKEDNRNPPRLRPIKGPIDYCGFILGNDSVRYIIGVPGRRVPTTYNALPMYEYSVCTSACVRV